MRLKRCLGVQYWEGLTVLGIERADERITVYSGEPVASLSPYIQSIWFMNWSLPADSELPAIVVPTPCSHLFGICVPHVSKRPLSHDFLSVKRAGDLISIRGHGQTFGVEFRPGGLYPFLKRPMHEWVGSTIPINEVFSDLSSLPDYPWSPENLESWIAQFEERLEALIPFVASNHLEQITTAIHHFVHTDVGDLEEGHTRLALSKRTFQRIFRTEVGLSPRETLRVARFHRAIKAMNGTAPNGMAQFALDSGFFDQPHMINEFRKLVGTKPAVFRKYM